VGESSEIDGAMTSPLARRGFLENTSVKNFRLAGGRRVAGLTDDEAKGGAGCCSARVRSGGKVG